MKALIIANPCAGKRIIAKQIKFIAGQFLDAGYDVKVRYTKGRNDATELTEENPDVDIVVCCGGDGTVNEVVSGLMNMYGKRPMLGYVPAGTTNDFANSLGLSHKPEQAAANIVNGKPCPMDIGSFNGRNFVYIASFGAFTKSSYATPQSMKNALGHFAYVLEGTKEITNLHPYKIKAQTSEGVVIEGSYIFGAVSNTTSVAGLIKLNENEVAMSDGLFEVMLIKMPSNIIELGKIIASLQSQKYDDELIKFIHTERVVFECEEEMPWTLDGEYQPGSHTVEVINIKKAITLVK
ncbi:MAG: YegS/Rv2252/BmrU family lipid kinase [Clostridia bacterium]|nr:YegS/Rv2252/BmrU family lipid kinase [Clostridia bacterium]